jgi:hypothetical protein
MTMKSLILWNWLYEGTDIILDEEVGQEGNLFKKI